MPGPARRPRVAGQRRAAPAAAPSLTGTLVVGRVGRPQGIRGEVTVEVRTDDPADRFAVGRQLLAEPPERGPLVVVGSRDHSGRLVVSFAGVADRNAAEALRGTLLLVNAADLPPTGDPDVFHDVQLVGLRALVGDAVVGEVAEVLHLPHGDVLAIRRPAGPEALVPFVRAFVPEVDLVGGTVLLTPPPGLLELAGPGEPDLAEPDAAAPDPAVPDPAVPDPTGG